MDKKASISEMGGLITNKARDMKGYARMNRDVMRSV